MLDTGCFDVDFQNCAHGGTRAKWTRFRTHMPYFAQLQAVCPGISESHKHEPWGLIKSDGRVGFAIAAETAYPSILCRKMCSCVVDQAHAAGITHVGFSYSTSYSDADTAQRSRAAGAADRSKTGKHHLQLMTEFGSIKVCYQ